MKTLDTPLVQSPSLLQLSTRTPWRWQDARIWNEGTFGASAFAESYRRLYWRLDTSIALRLLGARWRVFAWSCYGHAEIFWSRTFLGWWLGVLCDGTAGLMIWPAMPILAAQVLMPLATVTQLLVAYCLGLFFFEEKVSRWNHLGLLLAIVGVVGISVSSPLHAAEPGVISVQQWMQPRFIGVLLACGLLPFAAFALQMPKSSCWALATATFEALQFLSSRTLADAILKWGTEEHLLASILAAGVMKGLCILCILHFQQMGFEAELSRFVGIFMVATNLLTVVLCLAFFGDQVTLSWSFLGSAFSTLSGIWLLNQWFSPGSKESEISGSGRDSLGRSTNLQTAAAYAINLAAPLPKFAEAAPEVFKALAKLLSAPKPKKRDEKAKVAMDNAVAAMLSMLKDKGQLCPPDLQAWDLALSKLPIKDDCEEAKKVHEKVIDMVLAQNQGLLGADNRNLGKVLSILAEIYKQEEICNKECDEKILKIFKSLPQNMVVSAAASFSEKQQKKIEKMLHS
eukprot:symbB.v1.2.025339.t1/scaffold2431.1/size102990/3